MLRSQVLWYVLLVIFYSLKRREKLISALAKFLIRSEAISAAFNLLSFNTYDKKMEENWKNNRETPAHLHNNVSFETRKSLEGKKKL